MKLFSYLSVVIILSLSSFKINGGTITVKDYFSVPGPIEFNKTIFSLSWSAHPSDNYYKHEYLPSGEKSGTFTKMLMIEAVTGEISIEEAVRAKTSELEQRRKTDASANYQVIENKTNGEYLLDFVASGQDNNKSDIIEWNAYRYVKLNDKAGNKGILLFSYCRRAYGNNTTNFLKSLKAERLNDIKVLAAYTIPAVKIDTK